MESNGLPSGMFSNMGSSGTIGLEMSLNHHQHQQPLPPQKKHQQLPVVAFGGNHHDTAEHRHQQPPQSAKQAYNPFASKPRNSVVSDEDEPNTATEDSGDGKGKVSPWQRMKWTDSMVRLLIMVVFYIGDEVGPEGSDPAAKKKGIGVLQKKGKWKSVSKAMMDRGFFVSPQQCEDKFNDLNKRYKRVNDILGKGTACRVVENQNLLETMDNLSPKLKEEVKKLLNSKHLFFREMCAYHNSCGGGGGGGTGGAHQSPSETAADQLRSQDQQQKCLHLNEKNGTNSSTHMETEVSKIVKGGRGEDEDEYDDDEDDEEGDDDDEGVVERSHNDNDQDYNDNEENQFSRKKPKMEMVMVQQFSGEVMGVVQDVTKSLWEKRQWMKTRSMQLEEQRVGYQGQAFELEKQRLKWVKFSCKKERDMESEKLRIDRMRLVNDRMALLLRQKEFELIDLQQQQYSSNKRSDPSSVTG